MAAPTIVTSGFTTANATTSLTIGTNPQVGDLLIIVAGTGDANPTFTWSTPAGGSITFDTGSQIYNVTGTGGGITPDYSTTNSGSSTGVFFWSAKVTAFTAGSGSHAIGATNWSVVTVPHRWGYYIVRPGSGSSWPAAASRVLRTGTGFHSGTLASAISCTWTGSTAANPYFSIAEFHGASRTLSGVKWDNITLDSTAGNIDAGGAASVLTMHHSWDSADANKPDTSTWEFDVTATTSSAMLVGGIVYKLGGVSAALTKGIETDVASALRAKHVAPIGGVTETDVAGAMSRLSGRAFNLTGATETDVAKKLAAQRKPAPAEHDVASVLNAFRHDAPAETDRAAALTIYRQWSFETGLSAPPDPTEFPGVMNVWARVLTGADVGDIRLVLKNNGVPVAISDWMALDPSFTEYSYSIPHISGPYNNLAARIDLRALVGNYLTPEISQIELLLLEHHLRFRVTLWEDLRTTIEQESRSTLPDDARSTVLQELRRALPDDLRLTIQE